MLVSLRTYMQHQCGTYSCMKPCSSTMLKLGEYVNEHLQGADVLQHNDFHCTIVYSKNPVPIIGVLEVDLPVKARFKQFSLFGEDNDVLVAEIESEELVRVFNQSADLGAVSDWAVYKPHITLANSVDGIDLTQLPEIDFELIFDQYVVEPLED